MQQLARKKLIMRMRPLYLMPLVASAAVTAGIAIAPQAAAECNTNNGVTICSQGDVRGKASPAPPIARYDPYQCINLAVCDDYFDPLVVINPAWGVSN